MSNQLGPLNIRCDAPPYMIVQACAQVGFENPEDVAWRPLDQSPQHQETHRRAINFFSWSSLLSAGSQHSKSCVCGSELPTLERYTFLLSTDREMNFQLGQCRRCHTIYWAEV